MNKIQNYNRAKKLILDTINNLNLNLTGMRVLTEAGSGSFIVTPFIAALAGAEVVYVVVKDSPYGTKEEICDYVNEMISALHINANLLCIIDNPILIASNVNIVTNLGFVRPITKDLISKLPDDSAIPLMWETWELRDEDIDLKSCVEYEVPILGTKETDERLNIFRYVGMTVVKLLMEQNIEVYKSNIVVISSGEYLNEIEKVLINNGANIYIYNPFVFHGDKKGLEQFVKTCDAVVIAEQQSQENLISEKHIHIDWINNDLVKLIHVAGVLDYTLLDSRNIKKYPEKKVNYGYMTVTTDYVGVRPVIELHTAGLKVGQALVEGMRQYKNVIRAKKYALKVSPAMDFDKDSVYYGGMK